ncbi:MAG TPA: (2Fe-2S)-binding protein, partial [Casimicrobiaceae bacterium]|nr:(2Fe-2S)-binding protein [Casimicrobiaceae bacterium]
MKRRRFLSTCALFSGAAGLPLPAAWADVAPRRYARSLLIDIHGDPIRIAALKSDTNYVFQYPYAATPCFLLKLGKRVVTNGELRRQDGGTYAWQGGVGPDANVVAFSAICAHRLAYPTRDVSFIRFQKDPSPTSTGNVIHCCADHSVYDPSAGARVVAGPAPQPLAAILLEHDAARDEVTALGTVGAEQFDAFFAKYEMKLALEYG